MRERLSRWAAGTWGPALAGAPLYWVALPPLDAWPLAWLAPVPWIVLVRRERLAGRRPYRTLWLAGFLFWLAAYQFIRLPHPANYVGWVALAAYLGCYLPAFIGLSRIGVHRLRLPVMLVTPVVWTGLELARAHLLTGITLAALAHTQYRWLALIQASDLGGAYVVDFVILLIAASLARMLPLARPAATDAADGTVPEAGRANTRRWRKGPHPRPLSQKERGDAVVQPLGEMDGRRFVLWPLIPAGIVLAAVLIYGHVRMGSDPREPVLRVGLIQGSIDVEIKTDPKKEGLIHKHYYDLSEEARRRWGDLDLLVWPETMFRTPLVLAEPDALVPQEWDMSQDVFEEELAAAVRNSPRPMIELARSLGVPVLLGIETEHFTHDGFKRFNSAVLVTPEGRLSERYDKMHRVLFGEYVPLADRWPWLARFTPLPVSLTAGTRPVTLQLRGLRLAPNICYENVLPHVIRRQVAELSRQKREPDVLVNLTNDGWFRGASELDMHLACGVFRAIECRKPMLIAANTGFSAWIDADGRLRAKGPRREAAVLRAEVHPDARTSWYLHHGDGFSGACLAACVGLAIVGVAGWLRRRLAGAKAPPAGLCES